MIRVSDTYDCIAVGAGASTGLLLMALHRKGELSQKRVLILDSDSKSQNDKTYCFWAEKDDPILQDLAPIMDHQWSRIEVAGQPAQSLGNQVYVRISSLALYDYLKAIAQAEQWEWKMATVLEVGADQQGAWVQIAGARLRAKRVLDSRPPNWDEKGPNEVHLWQSFVGWKVKTLKPSFEADQFSMMDFEVPQQGNTQFVYVLPTQRDEALIELTRFGADRIDSNVAENTLAEYVLERFGQVHVLEKEWGCIPMSTQAVEASAHSQVWHLGARAGLIKPSTGYAFKSMYEWSERASNNWTNEKAPDVKRKPRHAFYDKLLLSILKWEPSWGKPIFERLFERQRPAQVFSFLDEKMGFKQELNMLVQLQWAPFMRAIVRQFPQTLRALVITLLSVLFLGLGWVPFWQGLGAAILGLLGLIWIGLPHGAVDHLLETGSLRPAKLPQFIIQYLGLAAVLAGIWFLVPLLGMGLFLVYSAWHFGQADGQTWAWTKLRSLAWGTSVLLFMLGTHPVESSAVIQTLCGLPWSWSVSPFLLLVWMPLAIKERNSSWQWTLIWLTLTAWLPLLIAFGLYFIGQHSWNGWSHITQRMRRSSVWVWKQSLPFHLGAWLLLGGVFWFWPGDLRASEMAAPFFVFLSCLSFPHVWAMHRFYRQTKNFT